MRDKICLINSLLTIRHKQAVEVSRRQARVRELPNPENVAKLQAAEAKMKELKANMAVLGIEASAALAAVEAQQQRLTFQRLVALVRMHMILRIRVSVLKIIIILQLYAY